MEQDLPPGFRFHPTDEELIVYYLCNQYTSKPCPASSIIPEVDIYKFDPPDLPKKAGYGEKEWYFFSPRERKYPNGVRPNRATVSGYWKATGTDKAIHSGCKHIGVKKSLVFYKGKPPKGIKTGWIMHEYRLVDQSTTSQHHVGSMRLDDWVLCRIYKKKKNTGKTTTVEEQGREEFPSNHQNARDQIMDSNYLGSSVSQRFSDGRYNNYSSFDLQNNVSSSNSGIVEDYFVKPQMFAEDDYGGKFQAMMKQSSSIVHSNQPMFVNQVYHL